MKRLGVIADIHGNLPALEAVIVDLERRHVDAVVNLGDCVSGPLWPAETAARLRALGWAWVRGNHDRAAAFASPDALGVSDRFARDRLDGDALAWLGAGPAQVTLAGGILALHARPEADDAYLLEDQVGARLERASPATVAGRLTGVDAAIILTAHSHLPGHLRLPDGRWVLNPGSVGCPAYGDDSTVPPHLSEAGSPSARYAILDLSAPTPMIEALSLPYDHESAARRAEAAGRVDWAHALRTGFMPENAA